MIFKTGSLVKLVGIMLGGICLFQLGCGGATPAPTADPTLDTAASQEEPKAEEQPEAFDLEAALKREFEPLGKVEIKDPQGAWNGTVEAAGVPTIKVDGEGIAGITIPVGTVSPINCVVYSESVDIGGTIGNMFKLTGAKVDYQKIATSMVSVVDDAPMLAATGVYFVEQNGQKAAGTFKMVMYDHPDRSIKCYHDELGYNASFLRVVTSLFRSFEVPEGLVDPQYAEVWTVHLSGIPVGFSKMAVFKNDDGTWLSENQTTMIFPRSPTDLAITDQYVVTETNKQGLITNEKNVSTEAGEISVNIDIEQVKKKEYTYKGEFKGKQIEGKFKTKNKEGLRDDGILAGRVKKIFKKKKDETFQWETYNPDVDPTKSIEEKYEVEGTKTPQSMLVHLGQMVMSGIADENGHVEQMIMPIGTAELIMKREFLTGEIPEFK